MIPGATATTILTGGGLPSGALQAGALTARPCSNEKAVCVKLKPMVSAAETHLPIETRDRLCSGADSSNLGRSTC